MGLRARNIAHSFAGREVLRDIMLRVAPGEIVGLVGPSGSGKTTLGRILTGRITPRAGAVTVDGVALGEARRDVAFIGQSPREACNPRWTLRRIIAEPALIASDQGRAQSEAQSAAESVLLTEDLLDRVPSDVSDGQLQRAVIARALVQKPKYLVCDEPTSMLDPITTATVVAALRTEAGVLFISHDRRLLAAVADRVFELRDGELLLGN
ncbi:ABC transporter ATP-binding protein [Corynebacterium sp. H78]|uniref:ABC transporter ATP-binding protein n=1 Tax=Corynebacterium sp. H78 TaxID=3133417 RepID=UPI0030B6338E